jgi:hypothetical protein
MVPAREEENSTSQVAGSVEPISSRKRRKPRVAVSIQKGKIIFFPTALSGGTNELESEKSGTERVEPENLEKS